MFGSPAPQCPLNVPLHSFFIFLHIWLCGDKINIENISGGYLKLQMQYGNISE